MSLFLLRSYLVHVKHKLNCRKICYKHRSHKIYHKYFLSKISNKNPIDNYHLTFLDRKKNPNIITYNYSKIYIIKHTIIVKYIL